MACVRGPLRWTQVKIVFCYTDLQYDGEDTGDNPEQRHTLYEGGSQDHVCTDIAHGFRLAGNRFDGALTDLANTYTGAKRSKTGADSAARLGNASACSYKQISCSDT